LYLALVERLAAVTGLRIDLVSAAALKPTTGERMRAEAVTLTAARVHQDVLNDSVRVRHSFARST
jgi:hypothetical protein